MELEDMKIMAQLIADEMESKNNADLAPKWEHGIVVFKPAHPEMKQHEITMKRFMHKIVMMRDALRVLEQQVNSNKTLSDGEKVKLQSYITKIYGSMTSFNFMFEDEQDGFTGQSA